jgi:hypothetical protein
MPLIDSIAAAYAVVALGKCPEARAPAPVTVQLDEKRVVFNNDIPAAGFIAPAAAYAEVVPGEFDVTGGIMRGGLAVAYDVTFSAKDAQEGGRCLWIGALDMTVIYTPEIYIMHEHAPGSCVYEELSGHEMKHAVADMQVVRQHLPRLKSLVEGAVATIGPRDPVGEDGIAAEKAALKAAIEAAAGDALEAMRAARILRHAELDTTAEYTRLSQVCPGDK